jgi:hypothetical protein
LQVQYNINEVNAIENGFGAEFALAQQNLQANIAAGKRSRISATSPLPGTVPLPIHGFVFAAGNPNATDSSYERANFASTTFTNFLAASNPNVIGFALNWRTTQRTKRRRRRSSGQLLPQLPNHTRFLLPV